MIYDLNSRGNLIRLLDIDKDFIIDLKYAGSDNFTGQKVYSSGECWMDRHTAEILIKARDIFKKDGYRVKVMDAYRPISAQKKFWEILPNDDFVARPPDMSKPRTFRPGHLNGLAVDVTLTDMEGNEVEMPLRQIEITDISIISYEAPFLVFDVSVSKGTYIRALARDIASRLDTVGHLRELERYRVGPFTYSSLTHIPSTEAETEAAVSLACRERIDYDPAFLGRVKNGCFLPEGIISATGSGDGYYRLYSEGRFIGIIEKRGGCRVAALTERENL